VELPGSLKGWLNVARYIIFLTVFLILTANVILALPHIAVYEPTKKDVLVQLYDTIGAAEKTLGWDNEYCLTSLNKSISLLEVLEPAFSAGSVNSMNCKTVISDIKYIKEAIEDIESTDESIDPKGDKAKDYKSALVVYREWIGELLTPVPPEKPGGYPTEEMVEEWERRAEEMKEKWMRLEEGRSGSTEENSD
jgi:hypothetical protein